MTFKPLSMAQCKQRASAPAPALIRRLAAFLYEGVLMFGIVMAVGLAFGIATDQRHGLSHRSGLQAALFISFALYFLYFWSRKGQTLAMKTWHLQLVTEQGTTPSLMRCACRYLASWLWFLPALVLASSTLHHTTGQLLGTLGVWILLYAVSSMLLPRRQWLHDVMCNTRLIDTRPSPSEQAPT
jgi:uncharacterized RDD family membrane protein YckC